MARPRSLRRRLLDHALGLPEAHLDHPWGEDVVKVRKKVFAFFGTEGPDAGGMGVKLRESQPLALAQPSVVPMGYGLGKAGWVSVTFGDDMSFEMLKEWVEESYRAVAPKTLLRQLAQGAG